MSDFTARLAGIRDRIDLACQRAGRPAGSVRLMGVTKGHPPETVSEAVRAGLRLLGESKVQEARAKIPEVMGGADWHFIGHLQGNKVRAATALFSCVQALDSAALAQALQGECERQDRRLDVLIEVNVSGERSKFGVPPGVAAEVAGAASACPRLTVLGLMTLAPWSADPAKARPYFAKLRELRDRLEAETGLALPELSMGMSGDFEQAILEGSTLVRIGTALFGERPTWRARQSDALVE